jgi:hypothetical protein
MGFSYRGGLCSIYNGFGALCRYDVPGIGGMNFVLHKALGGGGIASLRSDPQVISEMKLFSIYTEFHIFEGLRGHS